MVTVARQAGGSLPQQTIPTKARPSASLPALRAPVALPPAAAPEPRKYSWARATDLAAKVAVAASATAAQPVSTSVPRVARTISDDELAWKLARARVENDTAKPAPPAAIEVRTHAVLTLGEANESDDRAWAEALRVAKARALADDEERAWQLTVAQTKARIREEEDREWALQIERARSQVEARPHRPSGRRLVRQIASTQRHHPHPRAAAPRLVFWP